MKNLFAILVAFSLLTGCQFLEPRPIKCDRFVSTSEASARGWPAVLQNGDRQEIQAAAIEDARADIAAGKPRVAFTGGIVSWAVGIPPGDMDKIKNFATVPLPCGCTEPLLEQAAIYAEAYNKEILPYLITKNEFHK
jgi:hypothetical protein